MVDAALISRTAVAKEHDGIRRVLVVGPSWLGDLVMAQCLFKSLADTAEIDVLAPTWSQPLLLRMPEVRAAIAAPFARGKLQLKLRRRLGRELHTGGYDQAIVLPNSWKSALVPYWAGIPIRTGYVGEQRWGLLNDCRKLDKTALPMTAQRFAALGKPREDADAADLLRPKLDSGRLAQAQKTAHGLGATSTGGSIMALCPGAEYGPSKRWPAEYFAAIARSKSTQGWQVWLLGSANDGAAAADINARSGDLCVDLTGKTGIEQVLDLLSLATVVVSNDSGLMHIAAALDKPLVAIFGSTDPRHTPPLSGNCRILYLELICSPCFKRDCPLQHHDCMQLLTPDRVLDSIDEVTA